MGRAISVQSFYEVKIVNDTQLGVWTSILSHPTSDAAGFLHLLYVSYPDIIVMVVEGALEFSLEQFRDAEDFSLGIMLWVRDPKLA